MIILAETPVIEEILVNRLESFFKDLKWDNIYPYHSLNIGNEYPWFKYINSSGEVDMPSGEDSPFPSITILTNNDRKSPSDMTVRTYNTQLNADEFTAFKNMVNGDTDKFIIAPDAISAMETYFSSNETLYGIQTVYNRQDSMVVDIVTDCETDIKNRIYDMVSLFLTGKPREDLYKEMKISILQDTVTGNRAGEYNNEFGRMLHGCTLQFSVDYVIASTFYDEAMGVLGSYDITHNVD